MTNISKNIAELKHQMIVAEGQYNRVPGSVQLLAVSKGQSVDAIKRAIAAGQGAFGENYVQEALLKIAALKDQNIEWHFIGSIQSNKTKAIAENFSWAHSVTQLKIAERLSQQRPEALPPLNICIEVNVDEEETKAGVHIEELPELALAFAELPNIKLRGLMCIPKAKKDFDSQRKSFHKLHIVLKNLQAMRLDVDTLSMGMSHDFIAAIAEGATIVRIGTAIFGKRSKKKI